MLTLRIIDNNGGFSCVQRTFEKLLCYVKNLKGFYNHGTTERNSSLLSEELVTQLKITISESIKLVIFNNCYSSGQAETVTNHIECVIGINEEVYDDAAREFAVQYC